MNNNTTQSHSIRLFFPSLILLTTGLTTNLPLLHTRISGTGSPLSVLFSGLAALIIVFFLCRKLGNNNLLTVTEKTFGKPGKYIISLILSAYLFISSAYTLTETVSFTKLIALPSTPFWFASIIFILAATFGALGDEKGLLKPSAFIAVFFLATMAVTTISVLLRGTFTNLFPVFGTGINTVFTKGLAGISDYGNIILLFLLIPPESSSKKVQKSLLSATALSVLINFVFTLAYTSAIPYPLSAKEQFPAYLLLKEVYLGRFFHRIDALFLLSSALSGMFSLALSLLLIGKIFKETFGISPTRISIFPTAIALFCVTLTALHFPLSIPVLASLILVAIFTSVAVFTRKEKVIHYEK